MVSKTLRRSFMKICVIGVGYVGLVSGLALLVGHEVWCMDTHKEKITSLRDGISPIYEKSRGTPLKKSRKKRLHFHDESREAVSEAEIYSSLWARQWPPRARQISAPCSLPGIGSSMTKDKVVVVKSTVPVGTNKLLQATMKNNW